MRKLALAAACACIVLAATASAAGPSLSPHVWGVKVSGAPASVFNATWLIGIAGACLHPDAESLRSRSGER